MSKPISLLLADDHSLIRNGLKQVIQSQIDCHIFEAENGQEALDTIRLKKPQIAILDIQMPEMTGFEVAKKVKDEAISMDVIFLTMHNDEQLFNKAMDIGVKGFVLKENTVSEIVQCVESVLEGKFYLSPELSDYMVNRFDGNVSKAQDQLGLHLITTSERKILKLVSELYKNQQIADELNISIKTVQNHRNNICKKLRIKGVNALLKFAVDNKSHL